MFIKELILRNYRNYEQLEVQFENKVNVFLGENAHGKTNVMESIYVLALAKSHRTSNDKELIRWDQEYAKIEGRVEKKNGSLPLELTISKKGKKAKCNIVCINFDCIHPLHSDKNDIFVKLVVKI